MNCGVNRCLSRRRESGAPRNSKEWEGKSNLRTHFNAGSLGLKSRFQRSRQQPSELEMWTQFRLRDDIDRKRELDASGDAFRSGPAFSRNSGLRSANPSTGSPQPTPAPPPPPPPPPPPMVIEDPKAYDDTIIEGMLKSSAELVNSFDSDALKKWAGQQLGPPSAMTVAGAWR